MIKRSLDLKKVHKAGNVYMTNNFKLFLAILFMICVVWYSVL